jgi:hypothetical protein
MYRRAVCLLIAALCLPGAALHAAPGEPPDPSTTPVAAAATGDEPRDLTAGEQRFAVLTRAARGADATRVLVLVAGAGAAPSTWTATEQLRESLPDHGWSTWLLGLETPPLVRSAALKSQSSAVPGVGETAPADAAASAEAATAAEAAQTGVPSPDAERLAEYRGWLAGSVERIAGTIAQAGAAHPDGVVLAGEGSAAAAVLAALQRDAPVLRGVLIIEPVWPTDIPARWPRGLAMPALEILTPATLHREGDERRRDARTLALAQYRQFGIAFEGWAPGSGESVLAKRVRGWLERLDAAPEAPAESTRADPVGARPPPTGATTP